MNGRKLLVFLLVALMAASMLAGCGIKTDDDSDVPENETITPEPEPELPKFEKPEQFYFTSSEGAEVLDIHKFMLANGFTFKETKLDPNYADGIGCISNFYEAKDMVMEIRISFWNSKRLEFNGNIYRLRVLSTYTDQKVRWEYGDDVYGYGVGATKGEERKGVIKYNLLNAVPDWENADYSNGEGFYFNTLGTKGLEAAVESAIFDRSRCPFEPLGLSSYSIGNGGAANSKYTDALPGEIYYSEYRPGIDDLPGDYCFVKGFCTKARMASFNRD